MRTIRPWALLVVSLLLYSCGSSSSKSSDTANGSDQTTTQDTKTQTDTNGGIDTNRNGKDTSAPDSSSVDGADTGLCGNGTLDPGERCDPAITEGKGVCPQECQPADPCSKVTLVGSGCQTRCEVAVVTEIGPKDGCCPTGATSDSDPDCANLELCGNGELDPGETCDLKISDGPGRCPTTCDDQNPCTVDVPIGSLCTSKCLHVEITEVKSGDGCCPPGATPETDSDCKSTCGNGKLDEGELCDPKIPSGQTGACPTSCTAPDSCTNAVLVGSGCNVSCSETPITQPKNGDGCCPQGATAQNDSDCVSEPVCGDGKLEEPELCDTAIAPGTKGNCPKQCLDFSSCTRSSLKGFSCKKSCTHTEVSYDPILEDSQNDGCCLPSSDFDNDWNCFFFATFRKTTISCTTGSDPNAIPKGGNCTSEIVVGPTNGGGAPIKELVRVFVDMEHPEANPLQITLVTPSGESILLKQFGFGSGPYLPTLYTVDTANHPNAVTVSQLGGLSGLNTSGSWKLVVKDTGSSSTGVFRSWHLDVTFSDFSGLHRAKDVPRTLPSGVDPTTTTSTITVPQGAITTEKSVELFVHVSHPWQADLRLVLVAPNATEILLKEGDESGDPLTTFIPPNHEHIFSESFDPMQPLTYRHSDSDCSISCQPTELCAATKCETPGRYSVKLEALKKIIESDPAGTWTLRVENLTGYDAGTLVDWRLTFF